jgi:hypothetical protein
MDDAVEASAQCVCDHLQRPFPGRRNLLMQTAGNTVNAIVPASYLNAAPLLKFAAGLAVLSRIGDLAGDLGVYPIAGFMLDT